MCHTGTELVRRHWQLGNPSLPLVHLLNIGVYIYLVVNKNDTSDASAFALVVSCN
jgi:hypothetical protein